MKLTTEQLKQIQDHFGLTPVKPKEVEDTLKILDGTIRPGEWFWWHCEDGAVYEQYSLETGRNARNYPWVYSLQRPDRVDIGEQALQEQYNKFHGNF